MTDEKICPIMSRPTTVRREMKDIAYVEGIAGFIRCQKEKCMAWVPECPRYRMVPKNEREVECTTDDCLQEDRGFTECKGGCRLI